MYFLKWCQHRAPVWCSLSWSTRVWGNGLNTSLVWKYEKKIGNVIMLRKYGNMISVYGNMTDFWKRDTSMEIWLFVGNMTHVWKYDIGKYGNMTIFCIYDTIREIWYWQVWKFGNILEMWHKCGNTIHSLGKWEVIFFLFEEWSCDWRHLNSQYSIGMQSPISTCFF